MRLTKIHVINLHVIPCIFVSVLNMYVRLSSLNTVLNTDRKCTAYFLRPEEVSSTDQLHTLVLIVVPDHNTVWIA